jgi:cyclohexa-1,5-dienecarbonyl-CoA hydratase
LRLLALFAPLPIATTRALEAELGRGQFSGGNNMSTQYSNILGEESGHTVKLTINRPPSNVLNIATMSEINSALDEAEKRDDIHFIVLTGAGEKAFSTGVDVKDHTPEKVGEMLEVFHDIILRLADSEKITIAAVNGYCLGGGCELAMVCDFIVARERAVFGQPEINLGCFPPVAAAYLARLVGARRAAELVMTGKSISAREAERIGLVNRVVPDDQWPTAFDDLLGELSKKSAAALKLAKQALRYGSAAEMRTAVKATERIYLDQLMATEDAHEGIAAFIEKRAPIWKGK